MLKHTRPPYTRRKCMTNSVYQTPRDYVRCNDLHRYLRKYVKIMAVVDSLETIQYETQGRLILYNNSNGIKQLIF